MKRHFIKKPIQETSPMSTAIFSKELLVKSQIKAVPYHTYPNKINLPVESFEKHRCKENEKVEFKLEQAF